MVLGLSEISEPVRTRPNLPNFTGELCKIFIEILQLWRNLTDVSVIRWTRPQNELKTAKFAKLTSILAQAEAPLAIADALAVENLKDTFRYAFQSFLVEV
jgi:hypothetical protein